MRGFPKKIVELAGKFCSFKRRRYLCTTKLTRWIHLRVRIRASHARHRGSNPLSTTRRPYGSAVVLHVYPPAALRPGRPAGDDGLFGTKRGGPHCEPQGLAVDRRISAVGNRFCRSSLRQGAVIRNSVGQLLAQNGRALPVLRRMLPEGGGAGARGGGFSSEGFLRLGEMMYL